jgi:hypothetical protein
MKNLFYLLVIILIIGGCSDKQTEVSIIQNKKGKLNVKVQTTVDLDSYLDTVKVGDIFVYNFEPHQCVVKESTDNFIVYKMERSMNNFFWK